MSNVQKFIDLIGQGENVQAQEALNDILSVKAFEALEQIKQDIAENLFTESEQIEEAEQLDEISLDKASDAYAARFNKSNDNSDDDKNYQKAFKTKMHIASRYGSTGVNKAINKTDSPHYYDSEERDIHKSFKRTGMHEDLEQLDEISLKKGTDAYVERLKRGTYAKNDDDVDKHVNKAIDTGNRIKKMHGSAGQRAAFKAADDNDAVEYSSHGKEPKYVQINKKGALKPNPKY